MQTLVGTGRFDGLRNHPVFRTPRTGAPYIWGRFHPDVLSIVGFRQELYSLLRRPKGRQTEGKFLIVARARSGTTLLVDLLNQLPSCHCRGEVLHFRTLAPRSLLNRLAHKSGQQAFGAKFLTYQLLEVNRPRDPASFFLSLQRDGFQFIRLKRNTFDQAISICTARTLKQYVVQSGNKHTRQKIVIPVADFLRQVAWSAAQFDYEEALFAGLDHLEIDYETDLAEKWSHQATVDAICSHVGVPSAPVRTRLAKVVQKGGVLIENRSELLEAVLSSDLAHTVDGNATMAAQLA